MLAKTRGIVLKTINYSETSVVAKIYTEQFGLKSYLIHGVRKPKARIKANSLQLLSLLELEVYNRANRDIQHLKELKSSYLFEHLPYDIRKSSIALFMNELIHNSIHEEEPNGALFEYLFNTIQLLDILEGNFANFHLHFAIQLSKYLGFGPAESTYTEGFLFNLADGKFHFNPQLNEYKMNPEQSLLFYQISNLSYESFSTLRFSKILKKTMLNHILNYYHLHLPDFKPMHSHEVLETVLS